MTFEDSLRRLAQDTAPSNEQKNRIKKRILSQTEPAFLQALAQEIEIPASLKQRVLNRIAPASLPKTISELSHGISPDSSLRNTIRQRVLSRIQPLSRPFIHTGLKWSAAFAVLLLAVRLVPLAVLAPHTDAQTIVQVVPDGKGVSEYVGGIWIPVTEPKIIDSAVMIRTEKDSKASIYMHDYAVFRLSADTTIKLHDLTNRPQFSVGPTATLLRGKLWALSLVPAVFHGVSIDTVDGSLDFNEASVSLEEHATGVTATVYDRVAMFMQGGKKTFVTTGEKVIATSPENSLKETVTPSTFETPWPKENLALDGAHRSEILAQQEERRKQIAGILPTQSWLYTAKRAAEQIDVLLTFDSDAKAQKQLLIADTRLNEAAVMLDNPDTQSQAVPLLSEYRQTLIGLATESASNLVQFLINKQLADTSASMTTATADTKLDAIKQAVLDVSKAIPNADLNKNDFEGYVLVNKLIAINADLDKTKDSAAAIAQYTDLQPYIKDVFTAADPLLQAEAQSLLAKTSALLAEGEQKTEVATVQEDIKQYMPADKTKQHELVVTEDQINAQVDRIINRVLIFEFSQSRVNQLLADMRDLKDTKNPNRGTILRRLYRKLPRGLAEYARLEIQQFSDELKQGR